MNAALIRCQRHGATQCVHLFNQVPLANATDRRVATHLPQRLNVVRQKQGCATHPRSSQRGLGPGMAAADDDHVKVLWVKHGSPTKAKRGYFTEARPFLQHPLVFTLWRKHKGLG